MTQAQAQESRMVEMRVRDVRRYQTEGAGDGEHRHVVMLEEVGGNRVLPIWIGSFEATAIAVHIEGVATPRPLTYAFAADMLQAAGGRLREARISRLAETVFYAEAVIEGPDGMHAIDARPSDALNLALAIGAPIRVDDAVLLTVTDSEPAHPLDRAVLAGEDFEDAAAIVADLATGWRGSTPRSERETGAE